jgi:hypothetical protein
VYIANRAWRASGPPITLPADRTAGVVLGPQTYRFSQFDKMLLSSFAAAEERSHIARAQVRLLQRKLRGARQCRDHVRIK